MGILPNRRIKLTYKHYSLFPYDGKRHEIIDGDHHMSPSPIPIHQRIILYLARLFGNHLERTGQGEIIIAPMDVILSDTDIVQPDLIYVSKERSRIVTQKNVRGVPDLLIEVLSPGTEEYDRSLKRGLYARFGVKRFWIVDPKRKTIEVFARGKKGYGRARKYTRKDSLAVDLIPGLVLDMRAVFRGSCPHSAVRSQLHRRSTS